MKICAKCKIEKPDSDFSPSKLLKNSGWCRLCTSLYTKKYREENKEDIKNKGQKYYQENREEILDNTKKNNQENREEKLKYAKQWHQNNKTLLNVKRKMRRKNDPVFRLRQDCSRLINFALNKRHATKNGYSIFDFLSYTIQDLKIHLERQFEPWMTWDNRGKYNPKTWDDNDPMTWAWQLDHIIPQADLPYSSMADDNFQKCWALSNLRPLSAKQNVIEGVNKIRHGKII